MPMSVMIVDDRKNHRRMLRNSLKSHGLRAKIFLARSGTEAIRKQQAYKHRVILLDMRMPNCDGPEVLKQIRAFDRRAVVIGVSGFPQEEYADRLEGLNLASWHPKPVEIEPLMRDIEKVEKLDELDRLAQELNVFDPDEVEEKIEDPALALKYRILRLTARTALVLARYPQVSRVIEQVFAKEVLALEAVVKELQSIDVDSLADTYISGLNRMDKLEREILREKADV